MNILFVATESAPYFSTGGLADVVYGLSRELGFQKGVNVRVILPYHRRMYQKVSLQTVLSKVSIPLDSYSREADLLKIDGQPTVYLVDQDYYFNRDDYYGYIDDYERFIFFNRAVLEMVGSDTFSQKENGWFPDIIQGFDWIAGLFPMLLEKNRQNEGKFAATKFSLFIHNLRRSGIFSSRALYLLGEKQIRIYPEINETAEQITFLGRGVLQADQLVTVNPNYNDKENPLPESARYLKNALEARLSGDKPSLVGIPSGIDEEAYDPETDPIIKQNFSSATITERVKNKLALQKELKLKMNAKIPLIGMVSRLIPENGIELIPAIQKHLNELGEVQLVILADPGDEMYKSMLKTWDRDQDMDQPWIKCRIEHNGNLARQIYASCDICLIPAREMPSGITHLIAMRYGALPLVHHTGCMVKNLVSYESDLKLRSFNNQGIGVGFKFFDFTEEAFLEILKQALRLYREDYKTWKELQVFNVRQQFSWGKSANLYLDMYEDMLLQPDEERKIQPGIECHLEKGARLLQTLQEIDNLPGLGIRDPRMILKQAARLVRWVLDCDAVYVRELDRRLQLSSGAVASADFEISSIDWNNHKEKPDETLVTRLFTSGAESTWRNLGDVDRNGNCQPITQLKNSAIAKQAGWEAGWTVPMVVHGRLMGWIDVFFAAQLANDDQAWLLSALTMLANSFALRTDSIRISSEMDKITEFSCDLQKSISIQEVMEKTIFWAKDILPQSNAWLQQIENGVLQKTDNQTEKSDIIAEKALENRSIIYLSDWNDAPRGKDGHRLYRSILAIPLLPFLQGNGKDPVKEDPNGVLIVVHPDSAAISRDDEHLLARYLVPEAFSALQSKLKMAEQEQSRATKLERLVNSLVAGVDFDELLDRVVRTTAEVLNAEAAALYLIEEPQNKLKIKAACGYQQILLEKQVTYEMGEGLTGWIAKSGEVVKADSLEILHSHPNWKGQKNLENKVREPNAFLGIPLKVNDNVIGVLKLEDRNPNHPIPYFNDDDRHLAEMMANVIATVVYNFQQNDDRLRGLSDKLGRLSQSLSLSLDQQTLMNNIVKTTAEVLNVDAATLFLSDEDNKVLTIQAAFGYQTPLLEVKASYKLGEGVTGRIAATNQPFMANSMETLRAGGSKAGMYDHLYNYQRPASFYGLPLNVTGREKPLGVLKVESLTPRPFTNEDVLLIGMMGNIIAAVVYNVQQSDKRLVDFSSRLSKLSESLSGSQDQQTLMNNIVKTTAEVLSVDAATLFLSDEKNEVLTIHAAYGYQTPLLEVKANYNWGDGVTGRIAATNQPFQANRMEDLRAGGSAGKYDHLFDYKRPASFYGLPLNVTGRSKPLGVLKVESLTPRPFTGEDVLLIGMMGSIIATVVYNAQQAGKLLVDFSARLGKLSQSLSISQDPKTLMNNIVKTTAEALDVNAATLFLSDEDNKVLTIQAAFGYQTPLLSVKASYLWGEGVTGRIAETNQPFQANSMETLREGGSKAGKYDHLFEYKRPASFYGFPLNVTGRSKPLGVLKVESLTPRPFTSEDVLVIELMGNIIAAVVYNAQMDQKRLADFVKELGSFAHPKPTLQVFSRFASSKDPMALEILGTTLAAKIGDNLEAGYEEGLALLLKTARPEIFTRIAESTSSPTVRLLFNLFNQVVHAEKIIASQHKEVFELSHLWVKIQAHAQDNKFFENTRAFVDAFAELVQMTRKESVTEGKWTGFLLDTSKTFAGTYLPQRLFLVFHQDGYMADDITSVDTLRALLSRFPKSNENIIALLPFWGERTLIDRSKSNLRLRYIGSFNWIVVEFEDLQYVAGGAHPEVNLQHLILPQVNLMSISPYQIVGPAKKLNFFGRDQELAKISQDIRQASFAIIGTRRIGKTSILRQLHMSRLPELGFRTVYIDCAPATYEDFINQPINTWEPDVPENAPKKMNNLLQGQIPTDKHLVLLLDEADKIIPKDRENHWNLLNNLRGKANAGLMSFVLCGERTLQGSLHESGSPTFNFANEIILGHLNRQAVNGLVTEPMKLLEIQFSEETRIVDAIYDCTAGHPNVVQRLCYRIIERLNEQQSRKITMDLVNQIIEDPNFIQRDFLETYLAQTTVLEQLCVYFMAADPQIRTLQQIFDRFTERNMQVTLNQIEITLQRLVSLRGILKATHDGYAFAIDAFPTIISKSKRISEWINLRQELFLNLGDVAPDEKTN